jgi:hypothetical protein
MSSGTPSRWTGLHAASEAADDRQADARRASGHNCHPPQQFPSFDGTAASGVRALLAGPRLWYHCLVVY